MSYEKASVQRSPLATPGHWVGVCCLALMLMGCTRSEANSGAISETAAPPSETVTQTDSATAEPATAEPAADLETGSKLASFGGADSAQILPVGATTVLGGETIELEMTRTPQEQAKGLMFRQKLPDNRGMVFSFDPPRFARFWMKNVVIDLDMIFLNEGKIVEIAADVPPCVADPCPTYGPSGKFIDTVIELRGGRAAELGLQAGDAVVIEAIAADASEPTLDETTVETTVDSEAP